MDVREHAARGDRHAAEELVELLVVADGEHQVTLQGHTEVVYTVAIHPDGRIVSGSRDETLRIWA